MAATDELITIRRELEAKLTHHKAEIGKIEKALEALMLVESLLISGAELQQSLPSIGRFANLKPEPLALKIVEERENHLWTIHEIMRVAREGGKNFEGYKSPYSVFYTALKRWADKGKIEIIKKETGTRTGTYFRKKKEGDSPSGIAAFFPAEGSHSG